MSVIFSFLGLAIYFLAWSRVVENPFTWLCVGLMFFATLATVFQEWHKEGERGNLLMAMITVWGLLPFQLIVVFWVEGVK